MENKTNKAKTRKKKVKINFKKIKKTFITIGENISAKVKELWAKFMALPKKTRQIVYIWVTVLLIIVILIIAGSNNKNFLKDYQTLETTMNSAVLSYVEENEYYPPKDNKLKLDLDFLLEENLVYSEEIKDKSCRGFTLAHYDDKNSKYVVNSYINCDKYTTEGYEDYK